MKRVIRFCCRMSLIAATFLILASNAQAQAPCCSITAIDAVNASVKAKVNASGQMFVFRVADARLLTSLKVGQPVYANLTTKQVSLDGKSACCVITSEPAAPSAAPAPAPAAKPVTPSPAAAPVARPAPSPANPTALPAVPSPERSRLDSITCPSSVRGGHTFNCAVVIGNAPPSGATIPLAANQAIVSVPAAVAVGKSGQGTFSGTAARLPDNTPATISFSYGGTVKQASLMVLPVWIQSFSVPPASFFSVIPISVSLTAPAPSNGLAVPIEISGGEFFESPPHALVVPGGSKYASVNLNRKGVTQETSVTIAAVDPADNETYQRTSVLAPPAVTNVTLSPSSNTTPLNGMSVEVHVNLNVDTPMPGSMPYNVTYAVQGNYAASDVQGPGRILVNAPSDFTFRITAGPCGVPPCSFTVMVGNMTSAPLQINN